MTLPHHEKDMIRPPCSAQPLSSNARVRQLRATTYIEHPASPNRSTGVRSKSIWTHCRPERAGTPVLITNAPAESPAWAYCRATPWAASRRPYRTSWHSHTRHKDSANTERNPDTSRPRRAAQQGLLADRSHTGALVAYRQGRPLGRCRRLAGALAVLATLACAGHRACD